MPPLTRSSPVPEPLGVAFALVLAPPAAFALPNLRTGCDDALASRGVSLCVSHHRQLIKLRQMRFAHTTGTPAAKKAMDSVAISVARTDTRSCNTEALNLVCAKEVLVFISVLLCSLSCVDDRMD